MKLTNIAKTMGALLLLSMTACSNTEKWVNQINLDTQEQSGEQFVELTADVDTRALLVSSVTFPIVDPNDTTKLVGQLSLVGGLGTGTSKLSVLVKSSLLLDGKIQPGKGLLPNGTMIPVAVSDSVARASGEREGYAT